MQVQGSNKKVYPEGFRGAVYVSYSPREDITPPDLKKKKDAFKNQYMTTHWASKPKVDKNPKLYRHGKPEPLIGMYDPDGGDMKHYLPKPKLTDIGKELAGIKDKKK